MDAVEFVFTVAMAFVVVGVPLGLTCVLGALVRATSHAGLANGAPLPSGAMAHATETFARVRAHMLRVRFPPPVPESAVPFAAVAELGPEVAAEPPVGRGARRRSAKPARAARRSARPNATTAARKRKRRRRRPADTSPVG